MPYDWVEPEVFEQHAGVKIYHVYANDSLDSGARTYWFSLSPNAREDDDYEEAGVFDIRELPNTNKLAIGGKRGGEFANVEKQKQLLRQLIDDGYFKPQLEILKQENML